ncbi:hypothetical protein CM318V1_210344 [Carnobacterium maltaromaticum]|nr:hypothetical protein CM318V1_210344 [Carnobacterium maltaromaticum]
MIIYLDMLKNSLFFALKQIYWIFIQISTEVFVSLVYENSRICYTTLQKLKI